MDVKLLWSWTSPFVMRVVFALELKGIEYERIKQDTSNKSQLLFETNPVYKKIPVLIHNGKPICESQIIVKYIEDVWSNKGNSLLPADPYDRAQALFWGDFMNAKIQRPLFQFARDGLPENEEEFIQSCHTLEASFLSRKECSPFVGGRQPGFPDVMLLPLVAWIPALVEVTKVKMPAQEMCPKFYTLLDALQNHPSAKASLPDPRALAEYANFRFKK